MEGLFSESEEPQIAKSSIYRIVETTCDPVSEGEQPSKTVHIMSSGDDGQKISEINLENCTELIFNYHREHNDIEWQKPNVNDDWGVSRQRRDELRNNCYSCGDDPVLDVDNPGALSTFECQDCACEILLCENCHDHRSDLCKWCTNNSFKVVLRKLEELVNHRRKCVVKLEKITIACLSWTSGIGSGLLDKFVELCGRLPTHPIVMVDGLLNGGHHLLCVTSYGTISKLVLLNRGSHNRRSSHAFESFFKLETVASSLMTSIGLYEGELCDPKVNFFGWSTLALLDREKYISYPRDIVTLAKQIISLSDDQLREFHIGSQTESPDYAYALRCNQDLMANFWSIWRLLKCCQTFANKNKIIARYETMTDPAGVEFTAPIITCNPWGYLNNDVFRIIFSYIYPSDWEINDPKKRKGKLTFKTPQWAKNVVKQFEKTKETYQLPEIKDNLMKAEEDQLKWYRDKIAEYQKRIDDHPKRMGVLQSEKKDADKAAATATEDFRDFVQNELDIRDGKKRRKRKKKGEPDDVQSEGQPDNEELKKTKPQHSISTPITISLLDDEEDDDEELETRKQGTKRERESDDELQNEKEMKQIK
jgi:hypothetical protein